MHADAGKLLWDAKTALERIARFVAGRSFDDYLQDEMLRSAVERQLAITGEALGQLRKVDAETAADIQELPRVVAFRNILIHAYASVDDKLVWGVVETDLAVLKNKLESLLAKFSIRH
jgi:uncharacterized protein with HEPN domain